MGQPSWLEEIMKKGATVAVGTGTFAGIFGYGWASAQSAIASMALLDALAVAAEVKGMIEAGIIVETGGSIISVPAAITDAAAAKVVKAVSVAQKAATSITPIAAGAAAGAIAGTVVGTVVGQSVRKATGSKAAGAFTGAVVGGLIGGPPGAVIGGILGGIGGLIGSLW